MGEQTLHALKAVTEEFSVGEHVAIIGLVRAGRRLYGAARHAYIEAGEQLTVNEYIDRRSIPVARKRRKRKSGPPSFACRGWRIHRAAMCA